MTRQRSIFVGVLALATAVGAQAAPSVPDSAVDAQFSAWNERRPAAPSACRTTAGSCSSTPMAWPTSSTACRTAPTRSSRPARSRSSSRRRRSCCSREDGKLSLDDPVRKYIPELPDYARADHDPADAASHERPARLGQRRVDRRLAARHARLHACPRARHPRPAEAGSTSRPARAGRTAIPATTWPRSSSRASPASPFAEFTRKRIFEPLGMTRTSWRDDFTRIVKDRAIAYAEVGRPLRSRHAVRECPRQRRPADDGRRPAALERELRDAARSATPEFIQLMQTSGRLGQRPRDRLRVSASALARYKGLQEFRHSGTTGSYRAYLCPLSGDAGVRRRAVQRRRQHAATDAARGRGSLPRRCAEAGCATEAGSAVRRPSSTDSPACTATSAGRHVPDRARRQGLAARRRHAAHRRFSATADGRRRLVHRVRRRPAAATWTTAAGRASRSSECWRCSRPSTSWRGMPVTTRARRRTRRSRCACAATRLR